MPELHRQGLELVVDLLDAADHLAAIPEEDVRRLLRDTADVLADLLKRDVPPPHAAIPDVAVPERKKTPPARRPAGRLNIEFG